MLAEATIFYEESTELTTLKVAFEAFNVQLIAVAEMNPTTTPLKTTLLKTISVNAGSSHSAYHTSVLYLSLYHSGRLVALPHTTRYDRD